MPPSVRAARYAKWRREQVMPEEWIAAIEKDYPPQTMPRPVQLLTNLGKSAVDVLMHGIETGRIFRTEEEKERLLSICRACPSGQYNDRAGRCAHPECGCHMGAKTWLEALKCPGGHW